MSEKLKSTEKNYHNTKLAELKFQEAEEKDVVSKLHHYDAVD